MTPSDYMRSAFLLAQRANPKQIRPNPFVGALVVNKKGEIIGQGYHQRVGEAHAEVHAINDALLKTQDLTECILYVTMEPCSHHGKTPPCTDLILQHQIKKVVIGSMDPNPLVSGANRLASAGVEIDQLILPEIIEMNSVFNINQVHRRPKFILKSAITKNGKIADQFGNSKWISNTKSRQYVHRVLRNHADAILTTAKTVIHDDASMNIRIENEEPEELNVVVIDKKLELLQPDYEKLKIFYPRKNSKIYLVTDQPCQAIMRNDIEVINVPFVNGFCDLNMLGAALLSRNLCEVLIEAGGVLNAAMITSKLVDEIFLFIANSVFMDNHAVDIFKGHYMDEIIDQSTFNLVSTECLDDNILEKYTARG